MSDLRVKFMVIKESEVALPFTDKCLCLGINRASYYKWLNRPNTPKAANDDQIKSLILQCYHDNKGAYGKKRIHYWLRNIRGIPLNHKKTERLIRELELKAVIRKKWVTRKYTKQNVAGNLLSREFTSDMPGYRYVIDVSELPKIKEQKYYLCPIIDLFNSEVVSYTVASKNDNQLVLSAVDRLPVNQSGKNAIIHSDQGYQFTSYAYKQLLLKKNILMSHSRIANSYDNACAESFFSHFKEEFYLFYDPKTQEALYRDIRKYIDYYNYSRIHTRIKNQPRAVQSWF